MRNSVPTYANFMVAVALFGVGCDSSTRSADADDAGVRQSLDDAAVLNDAAVRERARDVPDELNNSPRCPESVPATTATCSDKGLLCSYGSCAPGGTQAVATVGCGMAPGSTELTWGALQEVHICFHEGCEVFASGEINFACDVCQNPPEPGSRCAPEYEDAACAAQGSPCADALFCRDGVWTEEHICPPGGRGDR